jgi:hypothetical protein
MIHLVPAILHLLQVVAPNSATTPFQWAANYIHVVAWPTICYAAIKGTQAVTKFVSKLDTSVEQIDTMATNHFPHMEEYLKEMLTIMRERKTL